MCGYYITMRADFRNLIASYMSLKCDERINYIWMHIDFVDKLVLMAARSEA
jgi:hypothetical protein